MRVGGCVGVAGGTARMGRKKNAKAARMVVKSMAKLEDERVVRRVLGFERS